MAHSDGDLVKAINDAILSSDTVRDKFWSIFQCDESVPEDDKKSILEYIAERYVHMRGCWFVKFIKNNRNKSLGETKAMAAPTRAKVAHKYVESKSIAKALKKSKEMDSVADEEKIFGIVWRKVYWNTRTRRTMAMQISLMKR